MVLQILMTEDDQDQLMAAVQAPKPAAPAGAHAAGAGEPNSAQAGKEGRRGKQQQPGI